VWKVHGPAQAILVGDALFALANEILLELGTVEAGRATRRLTTATRKLIDGQAQDISYEHRERVTVEECLEMEGNKTGALLACAVSIGAVLGGASEETADEARRQYARAIGALDRVPMPDHVRRNLVALADFVVVRER
jgi:geranylgeranyl diphosphate synthase, type I